MALGFTPDTPTSGSLSFVPDEPSRANPSPELLDKIRKYATDQGRAGSAATRAAETAGDTEREQSGLHTAVGALGLVNHAVGTALAAPVHGAIDLARGVAEPFGGGIPKSVDEAVDNSIVAPAGPGQVALDALHRQAGAVSNAVDRAGAPLMKLPGVQSFADNVVAPFNRVAGDLLAVSPIASAAKAGVGALNDAADAAAARAAAPADTATQAGKAAGFRFSPTQDAESNIMARSAERVSDPAGLRKENTLHNQGAVNRIVNEDAGLPGDTPIDLNHPAKLTEAQAPHNKVYNAVANSIESAPASAEFNSAAKQAQGTGLFAGDDPLVDSKVAALTDGTPKDGQYLLNTSRELRSRGYRYTMSQDAVTQDRGAAYLKLADAVDDEMGRRLPPNGPVSIADFKAARTGLAKIHVAESALEGPNYDASKLGRFDTKRPGVLTGGLKLVADVAKAHPLETGLGQKVAESGVHISAGHSTLLGGAGTAAALGHPGVAAGFAGLSGARLGLRKLLTRDPGEIGPLANDPRLSRFFPKDEGPPAPGPLSLEPSPGPVIEPHQPQLLRPDAAGVTAAESSQVPQDSVKLAPPLGDAFEAHQHGLPFNEPIPPSTPPARGPSGGQNDLGLKLLSPAESLPPLESTSTRAAARSTMDSTVQKLAGAKKRGALPLGDELTSKGPSIEEGVQVSPFPDRHIMPGSTIISEGGKRSAPNRYISLTPQEDGSLQVTSAHVADDLQGNGLGKRNIIDAANYANSKGVTLNGDKTMTAAQLGAYRSLAKAGTIAFDEGDSAAIDKALATKKPTTVVKGKGGQPVISNIRLTGK